MLLKFLSKIKDKRRKQGKRYSLPHLLLFAILSVLCGGSSYRDVCRFIAKKRKELNEIFGLKWAKAPSKSQLGEIFNNLGTKEVEEVFRDYSSGLTTYYKGDIQNMVAFDGKALKGSFDNMKNKKMKQILNVFSSATSLILGHVDIEEKTNEIPTAQELIKKLGLPEGTIYTADAMHCQKKLLKSLPRLKENLLLS